MPRRSCFIGIASRQKAPARETKEPIRNVSKTGGAEGSTSWDWSAMLESIPPKPDRIPVKTVILRGQSSSRQDKGAVNVCSSEELLR
jgi:hypothetical protein